MSFVSSSSLWMLPLVAAFAAGCQSPGVAGPIDDPEDDPPSSPAHVSPSPLLAPLKPAPADFHFLVDRSVSWAKRADRWHGLTQATATFVEEHEGEQRNAATVFPRAGAEESCAASDYAKPDRAWSESPSSITHLLDKVAFGGGSTLGPALQGTLQSAHDHARANPNRTTSVIILTDATPNDDETCDSSAWDSVAEIAGEGFTNGLGAAVHVHVISVVSGGISPDHFARMDAIADAGNGYAAVVNGSEHDVRRGAGFAFDDIQARMTTCSFLVPPGDHPEELTIRAADGTVTKASRVKDASACTEAGQSFYLDNPSAPHLATLCSGPSGRGGLCEATYVRAQRAGAPRVTITKEAPTRATGYKPPPFGSTSGPIERAQLHVEP
ncbi:Hypothetical protein A7982_06502 [Minicystis rosea]|nr:Hypothetical protein A7982_06502 [Minicystis rosea]